MRRSLCALIILVFLAVVAGCGDSSAAGLVEVEGLEGVMDCPSELVPEYTTGDWDPNAPGSSTADDALALLTPDFGLPPGTPQVESDAPDEVRYLFIDAQGHRTGWVVIARTTGGWFVGDPTERCA